jgi:hypothetical protein
LLAWQWAVLLALVVYAPLGVPGSWRLHAFTADDERQYEMAMG